MIQSTNLFYSSHFNLPISKSYIITSLLPQILLIPPTTTSNQTPPNSPQHDPRTTRNNRADTATTTLISKRHVRVREHTHHPHPFRHPFRSRGAQDSASRGQQHPPSRREDTREEDNDNPASPSPRLSRGMRGLIDTSAAFSARKRPTVRRRD